MTTKKAIELIKKDIEHYRRITAFEDELKNRFFKNHNFNDAPPDSNRAIIKETRQGIHEMLSSLYQDQIKYYENILSELN